MKFLSLRVAILAIIGLSSSLVNAQNCVLTVPADPLTATGLSTPWLQTGCTQIPMTMGGTASFVQATIVDLDTGNMYTYTPLILSATAPNNVAQIPPVVPTLPANHVVGLFGGSNGNTVTLQQTLSTDGVSTNMDSSLVQGNCVNGGGTPYTVFGQFFCCNCRQFMDAVYNLIRTGTITIAAAGTTPMANQIPALGTDVFGNPCPTTHSFAIVDQDQSDNTPAKYLFVSSNGNLAASTVTNKQTLNQTGVAFIEFDNGSDEDLVTLVQQAIGCQPWTLQDLGDASGQTFFATSLSNEVQALVLQPMPRAFVPAEDPMVLNNNAPDINKLNAYRSTVGQTPLANVGEADTTIYCNNLYVVGAPQIAQWLPILVQIPAPDFGLGVSNSLGGLLVGRYGVTVDSPGQGGMLNCPNLIGLPNPFSQFSGVGAGGPLVCPSPFNPITCQFVSTNGMTLQQALGVSSLQPDMTGQTTYDLPNAPGTPVVA